MLELQGCARELIHWGAPWAQRHLAASRGRARQGSRRAALPFSNPCTLLTARRARPQLPPACSRSAGKPPATRSAHSASAYQNRFLLLFGGGSVAHCYDDLWMLDTETMVWSEVPAEGPVPPPRAGEPGAGSF